MRLIDADALKAEINSSADRAIEEIGVGHLFGKLLFTQVIEALVKRLMRSQQLKTERREENEKYNADKKRVLCLPRTGRGRNVPARHRA